MQEGDPGEGFMGLVREGGTLSCQLVTVKMTGI